MKTLVTGASGFVGSAVARRLIEAGHTVRVLIRENSSRENIKDLPVEVAVGDLKSPDSLGSALTGCQALFHVAADYRLWVPKAREMYSNNVEGTRNIMLAAMSCGVERVVYTSSVATLGINVDKSPADECTPSCLRDMIGHYKRSKYLAEQEVHKLIRERNLPAVIVCPSTPIGPRDIKPTPTGRIIADAISGRMPAYVDSGLNIVHVDDVAEGHLLAFQRGTIGERYILGGENMSLQKILRALAIISNRRPPLVRLPHSAIMPVAYASEIWSRAVTRCEPRVTVAGVRMSKKHMYFTSRKANRELGYQARPIQEALREAAEWFQRQNGGC